MKYLPAGEAVFNLLGNDQKQWLNANAQYLAPYIHSQEGQDALHLFFVEFAEYVVKQGK